MSTKEVELSTWDKMKGRMSSGINSAKQSASNKISSIKNNFNSRKDDSESNKNVMLSTLTIT